MNHPIFYTSVPKIQLIEPLYELFGVNNNGVVEFSFSDVVKIAGHACPTVAGAYLMTYHGLKALYVDEIPIRGNHQILFSSAENEGVTGVVSNIMGTIVGSSGVGGFKGLGGQFSRNNHLHFNQVLSSSVSMKRLDTNQIINIDYHPELIPSSKEMSPLLSKILSFTAAESEKLEFQNHWNQRLEKILNAGFNNSGLIKIF